jgi:anaerobic magnesium-protoporphyrin IX monomethyl ester cyclase
MKILFVIPKAKSLFGDETNIPDGVKGTGGHPHLGIAYLTAFLKHHNVNVRIYDDAVENSLKRLSNLIREYDPDLIGITAFSYSYKYVIDIINRVNGFTNKPLVIGGPHVSTTREDILINSKADFAIKGEGEFTLLELVEELQVKNPDFEKIDGLIWRNGSGSNIVENRDRKYIKDLDSLPYPDFEAFPLEGYTYTPLRKLPIISSRGCPYPCTFCSVKISMGRRFRARSPENFVSELEYWYNKEWINFEINDDCYSTDIERVIEICDLIIKKGLKIKYDLYNGIRVDKVNLEVLGKLKESGCILISYGVESGNEQILLNIKKNITLEQARNAVKWANEVDLPNSVNFIIGHEGETMETATDSIKFAKTLPTNFVNFYNLIPYPGTEAFEWVKKNGRFSIPLENYLQNISYRDNEPIFETNEFTAEDRRKVIKKGFAIYERKILEFRLGKVLGYFAYLIMRIRPIAKFGRNFALNNKIGNKIYTALSKKSRQA